MASYDELYSFFAGGNIQPLRNKVLIACYVAADAIANEADTVTNHAERLIWAKNVYENPDAAASAMLRVVVAANKGLDVATIAAASDAAIQTNVDAAVDVFIQVSGV